MNKSNISRKFQDASLLKEHIKIIFEKGRI